MCPQVGCCDSLHHGCAQSVGAQPGRVNGEHLPIELHNGADAGLSAQEFCQIVMVAAHKQADFITQSHLPAVAGNFGLSVGVDIDPVRQLRRTNRSQILPCAVRQKESQTPDNISGVNSTVMFVQSVLHQQAPPGLVRARTGAAPKGGHRYSSWIPQRHVIELAGFEVSLIVSHFAWDEADPGPKVLILYLGMDSISAPPAQVWPWLVQMRVHGAGLQFILHEADDGGTRLLRTRTGPGRQAVLRFMDFLLQPGYLVMDRAMLLGIKQRAEE